MPDACVCVCVFFLVFFWVWAPSFFVLSCLVAVTLRYGTVRSIEGRSDWSEWLVGGGWVFLWGGVRGGWEFDGLGGFEEGRKGGGGKKRNGERGRNGERRGRGVVGKPLMSM